ncbi:putative permease [Edaphobacter aggregans]|uniref:Putative permease n=1 Tax=Edaphobacter aggregans TaxID=570835 RepID=A0A428MIS6_9BACT|nr:ABC transporter permease [Edaphobacter aggregans]RSL16824.1 putative permease [Edaphobacter aggregans]
MRLLSRLWALTRRSSIDRDIEEEMQAHMAMRTEDNIAAGMSEENARRDARLRFGNPVAAKEHVEGIDLALGVESLWRDIRYAIRGYRKSPLFAAVAIITLALGIGANTAIFQLLDAVRLRSLPIQRPHELVDLRIVGGNQGFGVSDSQYSQLTRPLWQEIQRHHDPLSGVFAWRTNQQILGSISDGRRIQTINVTGDFFSVLGIQPLQGRLIGPEDEAAACTAPRGVVSYPYWQSQMGGRPITPGTTILIDNLQAEIIGVAPPEFFGLAVGESFDMAFPLCTPRTISREFFDVSVMGRLKPDWTLDRASAYFGSISKGMFEAALPTGYSSKSTEQFKNFRLGAYSASSGVSNLRQDYDKSLWILLAITGLVLLIACANLANLMLARASSRQREVAVCMALGASRGRVLRQLLIESSLLAVTGAVLGIALAQAFSRVLLLAFANGKDSIHLSIETDWRVLLFAATVASLTCAIFGTLPAFRMSKSDPITALKTGDGRTSGSRERFSVQRLMVVTQISVSMVLLVGALLFVRSFRNLMTLNPGMRESGITVGTFGFPLSHVDPAHYEEFKRRLLNEVHSVPGVTNATTTTMIPLLGGSWGHRVNVGSMEGPSQFTWVSPGYFQTFDIPLIAGRSFNENDTDTSPHVAIVNQTFVRTYLNDVNPIGQTLRTQAEPKYPSTLFEIVGVVHDTKYNELRGDTPPMAFAPATQFPLTAQGPWTVVIIASNLPSATITEAIKRKIGDTHPEIRVNFFDFQQSIHDRLLRERLMAILSSFFGALAALLVMVGLYGIISYLVTRRRNEIGIRIALGATRSQIIGLVMRDAASMLAIGALIGTTLSLLAGRGAGSILFGLKPYDPATLAFAAAFLAVIAALASFLPAFRAAQLNPTTALRCE